MCTYTLFWAQPELLMCRSQGLNSFFKYIYIFETKQNNNFFTLKKLDLKFDILLAWQTGRFGQRCGFPHFPSLLLSLWQNWVIKTLLKLQVTEQRDRPVSSRTRLDLGAPKYHFSSTRTSIISMNK